MSVEKGDTINVLVYEMIDKVPDFLAWEGEKISWYTSQFVVSGSSATNASVVSGMMAIVYSLF
jgi:hypothetical protein